MRKWEIRSEEDECQVYGPVTDGHEVEVVAVSDVVLEIKRIRMALNGVDTRMEVDDRLKSLISELESSGKVE